MCNIQVLNINLTYFRKQTRISMLSKKTQTNNKPNKKEQIPKIIWINKIWSIKNEIDVFQEIWRLYDYYF